jgi:hypothetical protein
MANLPKVLTGLAALTFVLAVITDFAGPLFNVGAGAFSRACTNLALLAIALAVTSGERGTLVGGSAALR